MYNATSITIERAEGPCDLCGTPRVFKGPNCWATANAWLLSQSNTFPPSGGYDKHDFKVLFEDGFEYEGRLDCKHATCADNDLDVAGHVASFVLFYAGRRCPAHMTQDRYEAFLSRQQDEVAEAVEFLATYAVPGVGAAS